MPSSRSTLQYLSAPSGARQAEFQSFWNMVEVFMHLLIGSLIICYNALMKLRPLIETNPYLRDPEKFRKALITSVASSTAIETGVPVESIVRMLEDDAKSEPLTTKQGSAR